MRLLVSAHLPWVNRSDKNFSLSRADGGEGRGEEVHSAIAKERCCTSQEPSPFSRVDFTFEICYPIRKGPLKTRFSKLWIFCWLRWGRCSASFSRGCFWAAS